MMFSFVLILLFGGLLNARAQNTVRRDWVTHPAIVKIDTSEDIFAIGDVHGDYERLVNLLTGAKIIEGRKWAAGKAVLVFTGDMIDKGPNALGVIGLVRALRDDAAMLGGRVVVLMGNHEAEFLADRNAGKRTEFAAELRGAGLKAKDVAACKGELGQFLCSIPIAARVGDWFFSHAGNTGGRTIERLMADLEQGVDKDGFRAEQLLGDNSILEARYGERGPGGKSWFEAAPRRTGEQLLDDYAAALGVSHIVQGHHHAEAQFPDGVSRKAGEMFQWRGRLFLIDTGMSRDIDDSRGAVLHIHGQTATAVCADGKRTQIWAGDRNGRSGKAAPCR